MPQRGETSMKQCRSEVKPGRRRWRHRKAGFAAGGVLVVVLTYLLVSQQLAARARYVIITKAQWTTDEQLIRAPGATAEKEGTVSCSSEGYFSESCEVDGDVRVNGRVLTVTVVGPTNGSDPVEWRIRPYAQKYVGEVRKATVTLVPGAPAAACTVAHTVPAVLFAIGGHSGRNFFHDYSDVLVPLFAASRRYGGEVQFLISNVAWPQWLDKYHHLLRRLSRYPAVDLDADDAPVRCFPHVTVGLHIHKLLTVVPESAPGGDGRCLTTADFTKFQREAYALPRNATRRRGRRGRRGCWFVNVEEVARAAEAAGFEAVVTDLWAWGESDVAGKARTVNSFDAMLGVHGAGLTNAMFLPPGAVNIQVVPYGRMEAIARSEYGDPMTDMGLKYLEYVIDLQESTLLETLGPDHQAIRDPEAVHRSGWDQVSEFYLKKQDVRVNITRFAPTLAQAFHHLRQQLQ
ncbi:hypothetical protein EJB05_44951, partial [Eragrostis curvula]